MNLAVLHSRRDELEAQMRGIHANAGDRSLNTTEQGKWNRLDADLREVRADLDAAAEAAARADTVAASRAQYGSLKVDTNDTGSRTRHSELRDSARRALDTARHLSAAQGDRVLELLDTHDKNTDGDVIARMVTMTETPEYRSGFMRLLLDPMPVLTAGEADALRSYQSFRAASLSDPSGGYGVPATLDPSVILTAQQSAGDLWSVANVKTITSDTWRGVSSAGVSWSWDQEATAVSDDAPTLAQPTVTPIMARGFIPYSFEIGMDYPSFAEEMGALLMEGYGEITREAFVTGNGSTQPAGILTELIANTNTHVVVTTDGTLTHFDIDKIWTALPDRAKGNATWLMSSDVASHIAAWGDAYGGRTVDLAGVPTTLRGRPMIESSFMPLFTGTTGAANLLVVGDFGRKYVVAQRVGMVVEVVPHLFDVTTNMPTSQRGLLGWSRVGAGSVDDLAFRLLVND